MPAFEPSKQSAIRKAFDTAVVSPLCSAFQQTVRGTNVAALAAAKCTANMQSNGSAKLSSVLSAFCKAVDAAVVKTQLPAFRNSLRTT